MAKEKKTVPGRLIAKIKQELIALGQTDEKTAEAFNDRMKKLGYAYQIDAAKVASWKSNPKPKKRQARADANDFPHGANQPRGIQTIRKENMRYGTANSQQADISTI